MWKISTWTHSTSTSLYSWELAFRCKKSQAQALWNMDGKKHTFFNSLTPFYSVCFYMYYTWNMKVKFVLFPNGWKHEWSCRGFLEASSELCLIRSIPDIRPIQHQIIVRNQADTTCFPAIPEIKSSITPEQQTSAITYSHHTFKWLSNWGRNVSRSWA